MTKQYSICTVLAP